METECRPSTLRPSHGINAPDEVEPLQRPPHGGNVPERPMARASRLGTAARHRRRDVLGCPEVPLADHARLAVDARGLGEVVVRPPADALPDH
ncbi:hypothetical protein [Amycolatopsis sp. La24]|uniref:hypothetical protein n=1 Tax=Amycolatopsis sp. La24 TaxID=3028304 RepID=UPI0023B16544|nr:hypothetical protein [Amycolatopsis sp. La24]